ncbi:exodeoxyribonuclease III [Salicola sp. Rm-C-2C1-2]|uniref:exodeoxyribonuclease III n=1 Tax=Salicola sp. Rm-C-2C1-2 TaxID=3141321 RepID=UPI0032E4DBF4
MRFVTFNVNGIRARMHQLEQLVNDYQPDVIGLQETKVADNQFPAAEVEKLGYYVNWFGQKGHYGVALMSRNEPVRVQRGYPWDDDEAQRRLITADIPAGDKTVTVINGYFPQGESRDHPTKFPAKERFYQDLQRLLREQYSPEHPLMVMGDLNISSTDLDVGIGEDNRKRWLREGKCSFLPEEREWLQQLKGWGLNDVYRCLYPETTDDFSWFDYRSRGFERDPKRGLRIDLILATQALAERVTDGGISYSIRRMTKPSDHCPVWADFRR